MNVLAGGAVKPGCSPNQSSRHQGSTMKKLSVIALSLGFIGVLGLTMDRVMRTLERRLSPWVMAH